MTRVVGRHHLPELAVVPPSASIVPDGRNVIVIGKQLFNRLALKTIGLDCGVQVACVCVVVLGMVYFHGQRVYVRFQCVVAVRQIW